MIKGTNITSTGPFGRSVSDAYHQRGLSLVELMMGVTLAMILMAGLTALFSATVGTSGDSLRMMHTAQDLRTASDLMTNEIRRAGFWTGVNTAAVGTLLPFGVVSVTPTCVLYSYDDVTTNLPYRGFRLRNAAIEWMRHAANDVNYTCDSASADWQPITDSNLVAITTLTFTDRSQCINATPAVPTDCNTCNASYVPWALGNTLVNTRQVDISIAGRPAAGAALATFKLDDAVVARNEEYGTAAAAGPAAGTGCGNRIALLKLTPPS